jgi:predicted anti-sigma-YlaC factor YlaD
MNLNCEYVREVYPDVLNNAADAATATVVRAHIARCDDCRAEAALIDELHRAVVKVPTGLHERIVGDLTRTRRRFGMRHLAYAATVAAAVIGGSILLNQGERTKPAVAADGLGFVTVEDAMVSGTSSLQDLTIEELEQLLGEIES